MNVFFQGYKMGVFVRQPEVVERILPCRIAGFDVRIWYDIHDLLSPVPGYLNLELETVQKHYKSLNDVAMAILQIENVSAVEVKDGSGVGVVLYREWP